MPGKESPNWSEYLPESIEVLKEIRHNRKVRIGTLKGNRFKIVIRDVVGDKDALENTINNIREKGVPNYFGTQRFGRDNHNIERATAWFDGAIKPKARHQKGMYLSAARSWIFNHYLSERVAAQSWNVALDGDVFQLDGTNSCFHEALSDTLLNRVEAIDLHPTGTLWGEGELMSQHDTRSAEKNVAEQFSVLSKGLEKHGLKQERRSLRLMVSELDHEWQADDVLELSFSLKPGSYATSVLQELGVFTDVNELNKLAKD